MPLKLYVGNIAHAITAQDLRQLFSQVGPVTSVQMLSENDSIESKGFAHVTMATTAAAQKALNKFHAADLAGSPLAVTFAQPGLSVPSASGKLSAFGPIDQNQQVTPPRPARDNSKGVLSAFGGGKTAAPPPRRRGGSQHR